MPEYYVLGREGWRFVMYNTVEINGGKKLNIKDILLSVLIGFILTFLVIAVLSAIMLFADISDGVLSAIVLVMTIAIDILIGVFSVKNTKNRGWLHGSLAGVIYIILLTLLSMLIFDGFSITPNFYFMLLMGLFGGACGGIIGVNFNASHRKK